MALAVALLGVALLGTLACGSQEPEAGGLDFTLPDASGRQVALSQLLQDNEAVVIVFYRGYG